MPAPALNPDLVRVSPPPVMEARRWVAEAALPEGVELLNLSQAAPVAPPPDSLLEALRAAVAEPASHLYGPVLGDPALREAIAAHWSALYGGRIGTGQVAVTAGCNEAFCTAVATLCGAGEEVLLPVPWYFNHRMWLEMWDARPVPVPCDGAMLPDLDAVAEAIGPATRALVMVTPNNPTGVAYPDDFLEAAFDLCAERGIALVLDETYRDFHPGSGAPHPLFARERWEETLIHLYSFSKVYRLTGHRTGALICGEARMAEAEKFLDTVTICPPRMGQIGALHGLERLDQWVAGERAEILGRRAALETMLAEALPGWRLRGAGAYFAWVEPPFDLPSDVLARRLVSEAGVLLLPGTMFAPGTGDWGGDRALRIAFANADAAGIGELGRRLAAFRP